MSKIKGLKLYTFFIVSIISLALVLFATMYTMNKSFMQATIEDKTTEVAEINKNIALMVLKKRASLLRNYLNDLDIILSSKSQYLAESSLVKFEKETLDIYNSSFSSQLDIFFFLSEDGNYELDASSPFYDHSSMKKAMTVSTKFLTKGIRVLQADSRDGSLVALAGASETVDSKTGKTTGYLYAGIVLNNNSSLIKEIIDSTRLSEAALVFGDRIITGLTDKPSDYVIENCYNKNIIDNIVGEVSYCSDIVMDDVSIGMKFFQTIPETLVSKINQQNKRTGYLAILIVLLTTVASAYMINYINARALYRVVDYTRLLMAGEGIESFKSTYIYEFNLLAQQMTEVTGSLTEIQAYMKNIINSADAPIAAWDSKGSITVFNSALEKLSGQDRASVIGKHQSHLYSIFPEATVPARNPRDKHSSTRFESAVVNKESGRTRYLLWNLTDVFNMGEYYGTILQGVDITERKDAEAQLELVSKVFENTLDGIVITDKSGRIISCNEAFTNITKYREEDLQDKNLSFFRCRKNSPEYYNSILKELYKYGKWSGELYNKRKDGEIFPCIINFSSIRDADGVFTNFIVVVHDITERKTYEEHIRYQATHDGLTGLPNRFHFVEQIDTAIQESSGNGREKQVAVLFLDIDRFKNMNDTLGHNTGDHILKTVADRLADVMGGKNTIARLSGDEFGVFFTDIYSKQEAETKAEEISAALAKPLKAHGYELFVQMSAGISFYPENGRNALTLMKNAEAAMYHAKQKGRNNLQYFSNMMESSLKEKLMMESKLNRAVENGELTLFYQPKIDLTDMSVMGMEALIRWNNPELGNVRPDIFIPLAEDTGLILPIGEWVIKEAVKDAACLKSKGFDRLNTAINLSLNQFMKKDISDFVAETIKSSGMDASMFELEITENIFSEDLNTISSIMKEINSHGITFAVDDFGTGYSSIGYLKKMPINTLKIDRSYISTICTNSESATIVSSVILMAKGLGLDVVAEGAEDQEQIDLLKEMGCNIIQGYYFGRPMPAADFEEFLKNWK